MDTDEPDGNELGCWCGVSCAAAKRKITETFIPDRDVNCEKRNCQRGFECLETIDGGRHEGNWSSIVEGVAGHELMIFDPMKWWRPGPSIQ